MLRALTHPWIALSLLIAGTSSLAQTADLAGYTGTHSINSYHRSEGRFLTVYSSIENRSSIAIDRPFYLGWYLSPQPAGGCGSLNADPSDPSAYFLGFQYMPGLAAASFDTGFLFHIDLDSVRNGGGNLSSGWYCIWAYANNRNSIAETDFSNNAVISMNPLCYGNSCPPDTDPLTLYPVPAHSVLNLELPSGFDSGNAQIAIRDGSGRLVSVLNAPIPPNRSFVIHLDAFASGAYVITVKAPAGVLSAPFIKQ